MTSVFVIQIDVDVLLMPNFDNASFIFLCFPRFVLVTLLIYLLCTLFRELSGLICLIKGPAIMSWSLCSMFSVDLKTVTEPSLLSLYLQK